MTSLHLGLVRRKAARMGCAERDVMVIEPGQKMIRNSNLIIKLNVRTETDAQ